MWKLVEYRPGALFRLARLSGVGLGWLGVRKTLGHSLPLAYLEELWRNCVKQNSQQPRTSLGCKEESEKEDAVGIPGWARVCLSSRMSAHWND
jgi:hypothetical protein